MITATNFETIPPLDEIDERLRQDRVQSRDQMKGPRIGDYIRFPTGQLERISNKLGSGLQTSPGGSMFLSKSGWASFSGGLNPATPTELLIETDKVLSGEFWFFHHDITGPGRGVRCKVPCRLFLTTAQYKGFLGKDFQSPSIDLLKKSLSSEIL